MSLHLSLPDDHQITELLEHRRPGSISIYLSTDPAGDGQKERIELGNLRDQALAQLAELDLPRGEVGQVEDLFAELVDDEHFWAHQARSLVVFVNPDHLTTFQLPNQLTSMVKVSDRWHVKPLLRALTFPQAGYVLAISQNATRVLAVLPDGPAEEIKVPDLPRDAVDAVAVSSISGRSHYGRVAGGEGRKMRLGQFARAVDEALRPLLHGGDTPLILAAPRPMDDIYRAWNTYPHLAAGQIDGNVEDVSAHDLAIKAREVIDSVNAEKLAKLQEVFSERTGQRRSLTDTADVARAATYGQVATLFVDIDAIVPGSIDDAGAVTFADNAADADAYGVLDEIARRVWIAGGQIVAVRREDVPGGGEAAAILRWAA